MALEVKCGKKYDKDIHGVTIFTHTGSWIKLRKSCSSLIRNFRSLKIENKMNISNGLFVSPGHVVQNPLRWMASDEMK